MKIFFKNKTILITGNTGFKGSWLSLILNYFGANVIGYSLEPPTTPSLYKTLELDKEITQVYGDIRNEEALFEVIDKYKPTIIFHLAAQALVRKSYLQPKETYETNIIGTVNLFEVVRKTNYNRVIINVTSDKCYDNKEWVFPYRENDVMGGYDPYSSSKGCSELITSAYQRSFFNDNQIYLSSVRAGNVIGGGDWSDDRIIPDFIRAINNNQALVIRSPKAERPFQFVLEPLFGYMLLCKMLYERGNEYVGGWNFGSNDSSPVEDIIKTLIKLWGKGEYIINQEMKAPHEANMLRLDITKAKQYLKWSPIYSIYEALLETTEWYKQYYSNKEIIKVFTLSQIDEYYRKIITQ